MLPYENSTSGKNALEEIQKILKQFGCSKFAAGEDFENGTVFIQFEYRGHLVNLKASTTGYAQKWLKENPWSYRKKSTKQEWEDRATGIAEIAVYSILRDWVKSQTTLIETGITDFESVFLAYVILPDGSGRSVMEHIRQDGRLLPNLLS
mgnify:FL=1